MMGLAVTTVASGGLPVKDLGGPGGVAVTEVASYGLAITKVTGAGGGMGVTFVSATGGPAVTYATLDPATVTNTTLSNGNLTATHNTTTVNSGARVATASAKSTGKFYFEITVSTETLTNPNATGVAETTATYANVVSGGTLCTVAYFNNGNIYSNGANTTKTLGQIVTGNVIGIAVDLTAGVRKAWLRKGSGNWNGDPTHIPDTGAGGVTMSAGTSFAPVIGFSSTVSIMDVMTANFGASAFVGAVPSGFTAGWPA